jgi:hypothetical protein
MNTIGIYPGRFQPPHRGHVKLYDYVKKIVGPDNAYVATSDKVDPVKSPLNFKEKQHIWTRHGVPIDKVVKVVNPYKSEEITHKFNPKQTAAVFFLSKKDADRIPFQRKDGQPAYFQPYKGNENKLLPFEQHSYIAVSPTYKIDGKIISGTTVREGLGSPKYTEPQKRKFFQWVFGWFDISLFEMLVDKFSKSEQSKSAEPETPLKESHDRLKEILKGMIRELIFPSPAGEIDTTAPLPDSDAAQKALEPGPEAEKKERERARQELDATKKKRAFQDSQKKYRLKGIEQDKRDIKATDAEIDDLRGKI